MRHSISSFLAAAILSLAAASANATTFSSIYALGDSLTDTGNALLLSGFTQPLPPYFDGNFSNGPVWIEILAAGLGLAADPIFGAGGTNFAIGGAQTGTAGIAPGTGLTSQVGNLLGFTGGMLDPGALYVVWGGGNDVLNSTSLTGAGNIAQDGPGNIQAIVEDMAMAGATTFLIPNLPNIGLTPATGGDPGVSALWSQLTDDFNAGLAAVVADLQANLGVTIFTLDVFSILQSVIDNPGAFGISNTTDQCYVGPADGTGTACSNPDEYVFWDGVHPTAVAHEVVGNAALSLVPVPAAVWLFASALLGLAGVRRRMI